MAKKGQSLSVLFVKKKRGFASKGLSRVVIEFHLLSLQNGNLCDIPVISHRHRKFLPNAASATAKPQDRLWICFTHPDTYLKLFGAWCFASLPLMKWSPKSNRCGIMAAVTCSPRSAKDGLHDHQSRSRTLASHRDFAYHWGQASHSRRLERFWNYHRTVPWCSLQCGDHRSFQWDPKIATGRADEGRMLVDSTWFEWVWCIDKFGVYNNEEN